MKYDLFISYSRKDFDEVKPFVDMLHDRIPTLTCWFDITGIESGDEFEDKIIKAIDNSSYVIFALSENSLKSTWTKDEVIYAKNRGKKVIPLLLGGASLEGWFLFKFGRIDCIDSTSEMQVDKLVKDLAKWSGKKQKSEPKPKPKPGPIPTPKKPKTHRGLLTFAALLLAVAGLVIWVVLNKQHTSEAEPPVVEDITEPMAMIVQSDAAEEADRRQLEADRRREEFEAEKRQLEERIRLTAAENDKLKQAAAEREKQEAAEKERQAAAERAKQEAAEKAKQEAAEKARQEAAEKEKQEAAEKAKQQAAEKERQAAAEKAKQENAKKETVFRGYVVDKSGEPIIGAYVSAQQRPTYGRSSTYYDQITGLNGEFEFKNIEKGTTFKVSYVGYRTAEFVYNGQSEVTVTLYQLKKGTTTSKYE